MEIRYKFDVEKTIEVLLYITGQVQNTYNALKVLYFADKDHLARYGRLICGDSYVAMKHGPVPSGAYDIVKVARGESGYWPELPLQEWFNVDGHDIQPQRDPNLDFLSESDIECLDIAIKAYGNLPFSELKQHSHDEAYEAAVRDDFIPLEALVKSLPDGDLLLDYLTQ